MTIAPSPTQNHPEQFYPAAQLAEVAVRLDATLNGLLQLVTAQFRILGPLAPPTWYRISHARRRLAGLLANMQARRAAGRSMVTIRPWESHASRHGGTGQEILPPRHTWLIVALGDNAARLANQLNHLLSDPTNAAALAASPDAARTLRPLCRMLGVPVPEALRLPPRSRTPRAVISVRATPAAMPALRPLRPLPAHVVADARAWKNRPPGSMPPPQPLPVIARAALADRTLVHRMFVSREAALHTFSAPAFTNAAAQEAR